MISLSTVASLYKRILLDMSFMIAADIFLCVFQSSSQIHLRSSTEELVFIYNQTFLNNIFFQFLS